MRNPMLLLLIAGLFAANAQENFPVNGVVSKHNSIHAFINAEIHVSAETSIKRSIMIIKDDLILNVGESIDIPKNAIIHNLDGAHIYPSFIDPFSSYGLPKTKAKSWNPKPQLESNTPGPFSWNQALKAESNASNFFSPEPLGAEKYRNDGFGLVLTHLNDGIVRGSSAIVSLGDGGAQEELINPKALAHYSFSKGSSSQNSPRSFMGSIALLRQCIYDAIWANTNHDKSNISLVEMHNNLKLKPIIEIDNHHAIRNVKDLRDEFKMNFIIKGVGDEYLSLEGIKEEKIQFIIPINFPDAFDVSDPYECLNLSLSDMKHWELAPANAALLASENISFSFTRSGIKEDGVFLDLLTKAVEYGLNKETALKALTTVPAKMLGVENNYGLLKKGMKANFIICDKGLFNENCTLLENWVHGTMFIVNKKQEYDYRGSYVLKVDGEIIPLHLTGSRENPSAKLFFEDSISASIQINNEIISLSYEDKNGGLVRLSGVGKDPIEGEGILANGDWVSFIIKRKAAHEVVHKKNKENKPLINLDKFQTLNELGERWFPNTAYGWVDPPSEQSVLFTNITLWTNEKEGVVENSSLAIAGGKIIAVGNDAVSEIKDKHPFIVINGEGKHLTSGIIDEHAHIALRSVNESSHASSADVRMSDAIRPNDINIYRQLAGGVTTAQLLHGSANPIGGQSALIKMRWGESADGLIFKKGKPFIKFALGENVKQSNWGDHARIRFPQTRMGVEQVFYDAFIRAFEYNKKWKVWNGLSTNQKKESKMPHKNLKLECLLEVINDEREITCHSYLQSEINMLMHVADSMGFTINTFTHVLEGYKVAEKMRAHGAGASTFSDWWAYKYEVNDAIPHNGSLLNDMGVLTAFNSDDAEMGRRLNQEAAKAVKYGGTSEEDAWKFVTINPAKLLHIDEYVGSLKMGKDADLVLWSGHPLSVYSVAEQTYVDGRLYYSLEFDLQNRKRNDEERNRLIQKMLAEKKDNKRTQNIKPENSYLFHCDD